MGQFFAVQRQVVRKYERRGPHNIRDVLVAHILKQTGSYVQESYAIQDTAEMVAQHYRRFLPQAKAESDARLLNQVWDATCPL